jgi:hypothetical protein
MKKRRIAPTVVGAAGAAGTFGNLVASENGGQTLDPSQIAAQVQSSGPSAAVVKSAASAAAATKRRITPMLVTQSLPMEIAQAPADFFSNPVSALAPVHAAAAAAEVEAENQVPECNVTAAAAAAEPESVKPSAAASEVDPAPVPAAASNDAV